jgi:hypothetical protein
MKLLQNRIALPATLLAAMLALAASLDASPALASGSSASSASSEAGSASLGSISTSFEASSASSPGGGKVAAGEYQLLEVASSDARPDALRLKLQALAGTGAEGEFVLHVPRVTAERHGVAAGQVVSARHRPYGVEFALGTPRQAFFLLVDDDWYREMRTTVVRL